MSKYFIIQAWITLQIITPTSDNSLGSVHWNFCTVNNCISLRESIQNPFKMLPRSRREEIFSRWNTHGFHSHHALLGSPWAAVGACRLLLVDSRFYITKHGYFLICCFSTTFSLWLIPTGRKDKDASCNFLFMWPTYLNHPWAFQNELHFVSLSQHFDNIIKVWNSYIWHQSPQLQMELNKLVTMKEIRSWCIQFL